MLAGLSVTLECIRKMFSGGKDRENRPKMGKLTLQLNKIIITTNEAL